MSWTYSGDPAASDLDNVRFLISDTDILAPLVTNEEINFLLSKNPSPESVALKAGTSILAKLAREADYTIGPESVKASQRYENYKDWWTTAKKELVDLNAVPTMATPSGYNACPIFDIGMNDNGRG